MTYPYTSAQLGYVNPQPGVKRIAPPAGWTGDVFHPATPMVDHVQPLAAPGEQTKGMTSWQGGYASGWGGYSPTWGHVGPMGAGGTTTQWAPRDNNNLTGPGPANVVTPMVGAAGGTPPAWLQFTPVSKGFARVQNALAPRSSYGV